MIFGTDQKPDLRIYSPRLGRTIQFADGRYETDDPAEIRVLERNRFVYNWSELTSPAVVGTQIHEPEPPPTDSLSTAQLVAVLDNDTDTFPQAGRVVVPEALDELRHRSNEGDEDAAAALAARNLAQAPPEGDDADQPPAD